jgi:GAF domain
MRKRAVRISILTFLLTASLAAAFFLWDIQRRSNDLTLADNALAERLGGITTTVGAIATAQQGYVAPGQLDEPWFERMTMLLEQLNRELAAVRLSLRTADAARTLDSIGVARKALVAADERVRENLTLGQELMAADVIFSDGRNSVDAISTGLHDVRTSEASRNRAERAELDRERWIVLGLATLAWFAVVVVLMSAPASATSPSSTTAEKEATHPPAPAAGTDADKGPSVDLAATAALCTDLSRVAETAALSELLGRAASILDASGATLWLGAGEQLFAVLGHGYTPQMLARFGPIPRDADNAAAKAWRTGRVATVGSTETTTGGIVAPMFGPSGCIGVLAFESRLNHEYDTTLQAVTTLIAAQVSTAVSAWPSASGPPASAARPA